MTLINCVKHVYSASIQERISRSNPSQEPRSLSNSFHADVCGHIRPHPLGGSSYFVAFIDDYRRKTWVYFLKHKPDVFDAFKKFKTFVDKESRYEIKALRNRFTSNEFKKSCEMHGIHHPSTVPRSPQPNGVVKRKIRTILNMARSMLKTK